VTSRTRYVLLAVAVAALVFSQRKKISEIALAFAKSLPDGGGYELNGSGVPIEIVHKGTRILPKGVRTYCSGFTFATVMTTAERLGLLKDKTVDQIKRFQREWYGGAGDAEKQQGPAMRNLGIGDNVPMEQAKPGDFLQLWRVGGSGHSVVFTGWLMDPSRPGVPVGFSYRSSQPRTDGIGNSQERFSDAGGTVLRNRIYFSRLRSA
jgi:hypothetical protein